ILAALGAGEGVLLGTKENSGREDLFVTQTQKKKRRAAPCRGPANAWGQGGPHAAPPFARLNKAWSAGVLSPRRPPRSRPAVFLNVGHVCSFPILTRQRSGPCIFSDLWLPLASWAAAQTVSADRHILGEPR